MNITSLDLAREYISPAEAAFAQNFASAEGDVSDLAVAAPPPEADTASAHS